jgi:hypothetical protein
MHASIVMLVLLTKLAAESVRAAGLSLSVERTSGNEKEIPE